MASGLCVMSGSLVAQHFNYHVNDISVYLGRQRGGGGGRGPPLKERISLTCTFLNQECYVFRFANI